VNATSSNPARQTLDRLRTAAQSLAVRLEQSADALEQRGAAPDARLAGEFQQLNDEIESFTAAFPSAPQTGRLHLWTSLDAAVRVEEQRIVVAPALGLVQRLVHVAAPAFEPLIAARQAASQWLDRISSGAEVPPEALEALQSGRHGLTALVRLATQVDKLTDADWVGDQMLVTEMFGRTLALAAARGQLRLRELDEVETRPLVMPQPSAPVCPDGGASVAQSSDKVNCPASNTSVFDEDSETQPAVCEPVPAIRGLGNAVREQAGRTLDAMGPARRRELSELCWVLLSQGCDGLAWQVNRAAESLYAGTLSPGADVIRLWILGRHLHEPTSALAGAVGSVLRERAFDSQYAMQRLSRPQRTLLFAAMVHPALAAPATEAGRLLEHLAAAGGDELVVSFAKAVRETGDRAARVGTECNSAADHLTVLQRDVRAWRAGWSQQVAGFRRAEMLFSRPFWTVRATTLQSTPGRVQALGGWLAAHRLADGLIAPILSNAVDARPEVRRIAQRMLTKVFVGSRSDLPAGSDAVPVPTVEVQQYLHEAAQWAWRWLNAGSADTESSARHVGPNASCERLKPAAARLLTRLRSTPAEPGAPDQTVRGCLIAAVERAERWPTTAANSERLEPTLDELLGGELRRLEVVPLGPQAIPHCSDAEFIERLLKRLSTFSPDQTATSEAAPPSASPPPTVVLDQAGLEFELSTLAEVLEGAVQAGTLSERDHAGFSARVCALWTSGLATGSEPVSAALTDLKSRLAVRGVAMTTHRNSSGEGSASARVDQEADWASASVLLDDQSA
jgi:hypothetical protein